MSRLVVSALAVLFATTAYAKDARMAEVLAEDDVCQVRDGEAKAGCALEALQTTQGRAASASRSAAKQESSKAEPPEEWFYAEGKEGDDDGGLEASLKYVTGHIVNDMPNCKIWLSYFWPQLSFWAEQIGRRMRMVSLDDEEGLAKAQKFAFQASYLSCIFKMDPRNGVYNWSEPSQSFFQEVAESDSLDMPPLPEFFRLSSNVDSTFVSSPHQFLFASLACDIDWWARDMNQKKLHGKELCWDKVEHPGYGFSIGGLSIARDEPAWPADYDPLENPEFTKCQDHDLNVTALNGICPFGGHVKNMLGVDSWGTGVPEHARDDVLQCQKKMGPVQYFKVENPTDMKYFFMPEIDLGELVFDGTPPQKSWEGIKNKASTQLYRQQGRDAWKKAMLGAASRPGAEKSMNELMDVATEVATEVAERVNVTNVVSRATDALNAAGALNDAMNAASAVNDMVKATSDAVFAEGLTDE